MPHVLNRCNWPDCGGPPSARDLLNEIAGRAEADELKGLIQPEVLMWVLDRTFQCKSPFLCADDGAHVCDVGKPLAWDRLTIIWKKTDPEKMPPDLQERWDHWYTIATDLENFPTAVPKG